jgi:hypothetical protein
MLDASKIFIAAETCLQRHSEPSVLERYQGQIKHFHFTPIDVSGAKKKSPEVLFPGS